MPNIEHKESHQNDYFDWLSPAEQNLVGGEIGVPDARFITALNELQEDGQISSWEKTKNWSIEDVVGGIDWWVRIKDHRVPFGTTGERKNAQKRKAKHSNIPNIYLRTHEHEHGREGIKSVERVKQEILDKAKLYLERRRS